jgi:solute carrier family 38 (sodium-coupled neutral amino acid transporter), member 11
MLLPVFLQIVALCNAYTCRILLKAAHATNTSTFEELAEAVGGTNFMRFAQLSNIVLLLGNLTGDTCLLADLGSKSLVASLGSHTPKILVSNHGRGIMLLLVVAVIFPLSLFRRMTALEHVSTAGNVVVVMLFGVLTYDAFSNDFRGITSREVPLWDFNLESAHVAEAFALIGFSYYLHPLMMPMLQELPAGGEGVRILKDSATLTILGVAFFTFSYVGVMGAAAFGQNTAGDIMMNDLIPAALPSLAFSMAMLVYLSSCIPPLVLSLRCYLDFMIAGPRAPFRCAPEACPSHQGHKQNW